MSRPAGLLHRGGRWYLNLKVPKDLRETLGKEHIRVSLKTADHREARRLLPFQLARWTAYFEDQRRQHVRTLVPSTETETRKLTVIQDHEAFEIVSNFFLHLEKDSRNRWETTGRFMTASEREEVLETKCGDALSYEGTEGPYPPDDGSFALNKFLEKQGIECAKNSQAFRMLSPLFRAAQLEHTLRAIDLLRDKPVAVHDPMFRDHFAHTPFPAPKKSATLGHLVERYRKTLREAKRSEGTFMTYEIPLRLLLEEFGKHTPLHTITRERIEDLCDLLKKAPQNAAQRYPKMKLREAIIAADKAEDNRRLRPKTLANYFQNISAVFRFAVGKGLMAENPASDPWLRKTFNEEDDHGPKAQFTIEELNKLFRAPVFTGCLDDNHGFAKPGPNKPRRGRFWIPLLSLFHGFRCNEACQLYTEDIKERDGIPYVSVREEQDNGNPTVKRLKTKQSRRDVPLHPELIRLGFLEFVKERQGDDSSPRLFPELEAGPKGYFSNPFSKWFGRLVEKTLGQNVKATFHSFRHMFRDALREADVSTERAEALGGWANNARSAEAGYGKGFTVATLQQEIRKVSYTGLSLAALTSR